MKLKMWSSAKKFGMVLFIGSILTPTGLLVSASEGEGAMSIANIGLGAPEEIGPTPPIVEPDPDSPDEGVTGNVGRLRIDWVTPLNFGEQELTGSRQAFHVESINPNVQVSDFRGTGEGWTLQVMTSGFFDGNRELRGANLRFEEGHLHSDEGNVSTPPTAQTFEIFNGSGAATVMRAGEEAGMGTWAHQFSDVVLEIPAGNHEGDYEATLVWTLLKAPS